MRHTLKLCVMLFYAKLISGASVKVSNGKINVDEFLKTVIKSEKFDEIVDKIADKAVEKFSQLKNFGTDVNDVNLDKKTAYRVSEVIQKEPSYYELKQDDEEIETTTTQRDDIIGKIDTEAFMKKESADSANQLSLKYNQFKKSDRGPRHKDLNEKQQTDREEIGQSKEINEDPSLEEENKKYEQRLVATTSKKSESDVKKPTLKTKSTTNRSTKLTKLKKKKNAKPTTPHEKDISESSDERYSKHVKEDKSMQASEQKVDDPTKVESNSKVLRASNKGEPDPLHTDGSSESDSLHKDDIKINEENNDPEYKTRQLTYEYLKLPAPRKDSVSIEISKHNFKRTPRLRTENFVIPRASKKREEIKKPKPSRIPVREEGNRLYTFEKSPDYEDYHLARIRNHRKNIH